jgi:flagellar biosynthetic protein FlhB
VSGEKTESATPQRRQKLKSEGKTARSPELGTSLSLLGGCLVLQNTAQATSIRLQSLMTGNFTDLGVIGRVPDVDILWAQQQFGKAGETWLMAMLPLLLVLPALGLGIGFAQGVVFNFKAMVHFDALNPMNGVKKMFSMNSLITLFRSLAKVAVVGFLTWRALQQTMDQLPYIQGSTDPRAMAAFLAQSILNVGVPAAEVLLVLAIADYAYQRWSFSKQSRMSLQEIKEEYKAQDGDPHVKGQIRARQRKMAQMSRQLGAVPEASVVVTNPTHIAVALKYDRSMSSPKVIAMGGDLIAEKIKEIARTAGIPLVENVPLARGLFKSANVGDEIPMELYQAVAEVLAYVYSLRRGGRRAAAAARGAI